MKKCLKSNNCWGNRPSHFTLVKNLAVLPENQRLPKELEGTACLETEPTKDPSSSSRHGNFPHLRSKDLESWECKRLQDVFRSIGWQTFLQNLNSGPSMDNRFLQLYHLFQNESVQVSTDASLQFETKFCKNLYFFYLILCWESIKTIICLIDSHKSFIFSARSYYFFLFWVSNLHVRVIPIKTTSSFFRALKHKSKLASIF